jgi:hypothetical protein
VRDLLAHRVRCRDAQPLLDQGRHAGAELVFAFAGITLRRAAQPPQQRVEVRFAPGGAGVQPAQRPGPGQQRALGRAGFAGVELVLQGRRAAEVLQHEHAVAAVVGQQLRAHALVRRKRREQLVADRLLGERVGLARLRLVRVVLDHQRPRQRERRRHHPRADHRRRSAAREVFGRDQRDRAAEPAREDCLARRDGRGDSELLGSCPDPSIAGGGGVDCHCHRPYS